MIPLLLVASSLAACGSDSTPSTTSSQSACTKSKITPSINYTAAALKTSATLDGDSFACVGDWAYAKVTVKSASGKTNRATWLFKKDPTGNWAPADILRECGTGGDLPGDVAKVACNK